MIVRVDPVTAFVRYETSQVGTPMRQSFGWRSKSGLHVRIRIFEESCLRSISFNSALHDFAGVHAHDEMFKQQCTDQRRQKLGPGVAAVTNYKNWYVNDSHFVMQVDEKRDSARLVIDQNDNPAQISFVESVEIRGIEAPITFEWGAEKLLAIRFQAAKTFLGDGVVSNSAHSSADTWPLLTD